MSNNQENKNLWGNLWLFVLPNLPYKKNHFPPISVFGKNEVILPTNFKDLGSNSKMLTCTLKTQVNKLNIEIVYWNVWITFNL